MKIDRRKGKRPIKPFCSGDHIFNNFTISRSGAPIKKCKLCPAIMTKEEFLNSKTTTIQQSNFKRLAVSHVDLFNF